MGAPVITVCIPVFNRSLRLRATIDSVIGQTFTEWELLVVDDGSTDDTPQVVSEYRDSRIRYVRQENQGQAVARNRGLAEARGQAIAFLDHDDRWVPGKLREQLDLLDVDSQYGVVYSEISLIDEEGRWIRDLALPSPQGWVYEELLAQHNFLWTMSNPLIRTELLREVGGFDPAAGLSDDWDLFLRLARVARFGCTQSRLVLYNLGNEHSQTRDVFRVFSSELALVRRYAASAQTSPGARSAAWSSLRQRFAGAFREQGWHSLRSGHLPRAWRCYGQALQLRPKYVVDPIVVKDLASLLRATLRSRGQLVSSGSRFGS